MTQVSYLLSPVLLVDSGMLPYLLSPVLIASPFRLSSLASSLNLMEPFQVVQDSVVLGPAHHLEEILHRVSASEVSTGWPLAGRVKA